jgi:hypothetical protein
MNNQTLNISKQELITLLMSVEKSTFVNIVSETIVRMNKTNNPFFNGVKKLSSSNYLIGNEYEVRVQNNEGKEGHEKTFESEENKNGVHISKCVLFNEKLNTHYLQYEYFENSKPKTTYVFEGNEIEKVLFESYLVKKSETSRQQQDKKVRFQSFKIDSIKEISLNGTKYIIE